MTRASSLVDRLQEARARLAALLDTIDAKAWTKVPAPDAWSIGREAEHVAEASGYHQWIVRRTISDKVSSRRPALERQELLPNRSAAEVLELIRHATEEAAGLIGGLTDAQLALPTRPPRARAERLGETIERVLIGHYDAHRLEIQAKVGTED